ncbi:dihydropteroate synthase [Taylorella equigenitalis]|uniref:Dihydropteroate synthase n=1 Tax=Taylorella equigenitalis ATCC 35865 TaxID=743973 RepID=A0ABM5NBL2_9BURK|nr:dihydropteroate synthase [Taylorella equigenitalis]AFN36288.1 dihydropteroate synthase [Taylorella equigenitalis ATCC 35865]ASY39688.1 dihydropteroate synthase [Taylorella equigenitalis]VEG32132.1 Dihydropteroate synthase [Taylorella equigenitalis ATCC 35865]
MVSPFLCGRFEIDIESTPRIMGIVNVTPDSFSDGGLHATTDTAIAHALKLIEDGADILDIGGESTRPGSNPVSAEDELARILPVIEGLKNTNVPLSVDTFKPEVMKLALDAGADMINDVYGLQKDGAIEVIAKYSKAGVCIMHMHGDPKTMQLSPPDYGGDVVEFMKNFLLQRAKEAEKGGIASNRICIDPGCGFGKTLIQNYELLANLDSLKDLGYAILLGISRKGMLGSVINVPPQERVIASVYGAMVGLDLGAHIIRVHDVLETRQAFKIRDMIIKNRRS